jgi:hypothetical protein
VTLACQSSRRRPERSAAALTWGKFNRQVWGVSLRHQHQPTILDAVAKFDTFDESNDPYGEHDFGALEIEGERLFWKIDYYDRNLSAHSPDPADPSVTTRVLTIMLADEY